MLHAAPSASFTPHTAILTLISEIKGLGEGPGRRKESPKRRAARPCSSAFVSSAPCTSQSPQVVAGVLRRWTSFSGNVAVGFYFPLPFIPQYWLCTCCQRSHWGKEETSHCGISLPAGYVSYTMGLGALESRKGRHRRDGICKLVGGEEARRSLEKSVISDPSTEARRVSAWPQRMLNSGTTGQGSSSGL